MNKKVLVWLFVLLIGIGAIGTAHADSNLSGTWLGESYDIDLDDTFDDIEGEWGDIVYDLDVDGTFNDIDGTINGQRVDIDFDSTFHDIEGTLPCGEVDLDYDLTFHDVEGTICGEEVDWDFDSAEETLWGAKSLIFAYLLYEFPEPTHFAIERFIEARIQFIEPGDLD